MGLEVQSDRNGEDRRHVEGWGGEDGVRYGLDSILNTK